MSSVSLRVLHLITVSEAGGAQSVVAELVNGTAAAGHEVALASDPEGQLWTLLDPRVRRFEIPSLKKRIEPVSDLKSFLSFRRILRTYKPDVIHLHSSKSGVFGRFLAGRRRKSIVYTVHGFDTIRKGHRVFLPIEQALSGSCAAIVAVSEYDRQGLAECGIRKHVQVIHNGIGDMRKHYRPDEAIAARMRKDREAGYTVILSIARLAVPKRYDLFRDVARAMSGAPVRFYWMGGKPSASSIDIPPNVRFLGDVYNAGSYIVECDIFTLLSDFEGLPISVLEALSWGKPIVASNVGGIPEELAGGAGILVENDTVCVERAFRELTEDSGLRARIAKKARARYIEKFDTRVMVDSYLSLYATLPGVHLKGK